MTQLEEEEDKFNRVKLVKNNQRKIMMVDDEAFNLIAMQGLMRVLGLEDMAKKVDKCFNGEEAVQLVQNAIREGDPYRYSLILTDCSMPFMDGYDATKKIRKLIRNYDEEEGS